MTPNKIRSIEDTAYFAIAAHRGQKDKTGRPYMWHLYEVAAKVRDTSHDDDLIHVAFLHDIVEDGHADMGTIRTMFNRKIANLVDAVTRQKGEQYDAYIDRVIAAGYKAMCVKMADLGANLARIDSIGDQPTRDRLTEKYTRAIKRITNASRQWSASL